MEAADAYPDVVIGCAGGGSNFGGIAFPFIGKKLRDKRDVRVIAVEPAACPSLTRGRYAFDFGDTGHLTPLVKMHTLGSTFIPPGFHAGGLRYHGMSALVSHCKELGLIEARAYHQNPCFEAGVLFARNEGIVPAPESNHAVKAAVDEALKAREEGKSPTILFNLSATAISTCRPTSTISQASCSTRTTTRRPSKPRSPNCRKWPRSRRVRSVSRRCARWRADEGARRALSPAKDVARALGRFLASRDASGRGGDPARIPTTRPRRSPRRRLGRALGSPRGQGRVEALRVQRPRRRRAAPGGAAALGRWAGP